MCPTVGWPEGMGEVESCAACLIHNKLKAWRGCGVRSEVKIICIFCLKPSDLTAMISVAELWGINGILLMEEQWEF